MKWTAVIFVALALALGFSLGRTTAPVLENELTSVASFKQALEAALAEARARQKQTSANELSLKQSR